MRENIKGKKRTGWIILLIVLGLIIIFRLLLPVFILDYANKELNKIPDYRGKIGDFKMSVISGNYLIKNVELHEAESKIDDPLIAAEQIKFKIDYESLLRGKIVGELEVNNSEINFIQGPTEEESQDEVDDDLIKTLEELMPVTIDRFRLNNGKVRYRDITQSPVLDLEVYNINMTATNLSNRPSKDKLLPSAVIGSANTTGNGKVEFELKLNPMAEVPTFDLNMEIRNLDLTALSHYTKEAAKLNIVGGTFELFTEIAAQDGFFKGYMKPMINDLKVSPLNKDDTGVLQRLYESATTIIRDILEAPKEEQVALEIPLEGRFDDPKASIWRAVSTLLKNAFIEALVPSIDHTINIGEVEEVIEENTEE